MDHDIQGHRLSLSKIKSNDLRKFDAFFRAFFLRFCWEMFPRCVRYYFLFDSVQNKRVTKRQNPLLFQFHSKKELSLIQEKEASLWNVNNRTESQRRIQRQLFPLLVCFVCSAMELFSSRRWRIVSAQVVSCCV